MNIEKIEKLKKCISCGACEISCPTKAISMEYNAKSGFFRPVVNHDKCVDCSKCLKTCSAAQQRKNDCLLGKYQNILLAHANNECIRHNATSGGVITALMLFLLRHNIVDGAIMTGYDKDSPIEAQPYLIDRSNMDLLEERTRDFSSRYVNVPLLRILKEVNGKYRRIAIVGTPCQIRSLNLLIQNNSVHFESILKVGIACSGGMSYLATQEYKRKKNTESAKMYYRGDGWPGKNCLESAERTVEYPHLGSMFERMFSSQVFKNPGCRWCTDHFAEEADISFCDFWNADEIKNEKEGNSCIIIRSPFFNNIISAMMEEGTIQKVRSLTEEEVIATQKTVLEVKKGTVRQTFKYKLFMRIIDFVFYFRIYRFFNEKIYKKICVFYSRVCKENKK